ncbi:MAG: hypothetical protein R3F02_13645 [Thiolinea sp.]
MMNSDKSDKLIDEARLLLPWYLTNKLSVEEQELVSKALEQSAELRKEFLKEEQMMRLVKDNSRLLELSALDTTEQRLANTLARIEQDDKWGAEENSFNDAVERQRPVPTRVSWWKKLFSTPLFELDWLSPANAVFAGLLVLQVGVLAYMQLTASPEPSATYKSASVANPVTDNNATGRQKMLFLVEFQEDAQHVEVCDFLNEWNARIVGGPDSMNLFSVEMSTGSAKDAEAVVDAIRQQAADKKSPVSFIGAQYQDQ